MPIRSCSRSRTTFPRRPFRMRRLLLSTFCRRTLSNRNARAGQLHAALSRPCRVTLDWTPGATDISVDNIQALRNSSRFLSACGRGELSAGRVSQAMGYFLDNMRLAHRTAHGGLLVDWLVGVAIEGAGIQDLASIRHQLSLEQVRDVRRTLLALEVDRESWDVVRQRDRDWMWLVWGWRGRLEMFLEQPVSAWFSSGPLLPSETTHFVDVGRRARFGLLVTELPFASTSSNTAGRPKRWPNWFRVTCGNSQRSLSGQPLVYRQRGNGYLLYSVGANGIDDGGVAAEWSEMLQGHGDLFWTPRPRRPPSLRLRSGGQMARTEFGEDPLLET